MVLDVFNKRVSYFFKMSFLYSCRSKLCQVMGNEFTEHEMITIARAFSATCYKERFDRSKIR